MKRILLIQAISMEGMDIERVYPIGIVTLASCIEKAGRYSLEIFDMNMAADPYGELREKSFPLPLPCPLSGVICPTLP